MEASDVASAFFKVIKKCGCPENVWFWLDNCAGQGKNWYLFTAIIQSLNTWCKTITITLLYLHKGHTFKAADGAHGDIGKVMKKTPKIGDFDAFACICSNSSENTEALILDYQDVYKFASMVRSRNSAKSKVPLLSTLVEIQFRKGSQAMFVKRDFDEEDYEEVHFLKESSVKSKKNLSFPESKSSKRGITSKKDGIFSCLVGVTQKERSFWENLHVNNSSKNLCIECDAEEAVIEERQPSTQNKRKDNLNQRKKI